ncbi:tetratricopeptide repeat protein [Chryseobacterium sp. RLHN22]|uniref:tetratricopeptide repeat protein n=1 Tax=Chryseobacterium sp. RLHN22 TaxID=3437885 RepID=UPI003D9BA07D
MKIKICFFIFFLSFSITIYSQNKTLTGKWILDRIQFSNGSNLEINNPEYSTKIIYQIEPNSLKIIDQKFDASFTANQIKTQFRTINYILKNNYLIIQEEKDKKVYYFLKAEEFVKKYPDFSLKKTIRNNDTIYIANNLSDFNFDNDLSFHEYISQNMSQKDRPSKSFENLYFKVEFILTKNNKIKDIEIINSIDNVYDNDYISSLKKSEKFLRNISDKDLLITNEVHHVKWKNDLTNSDEKKLYKLRAKGLEYYYSNKFEKAIENFSQIENLKIKDNKFKGFIKESRIKLGISYLATGKNEDACNIFYKVGDKTTFEVRNFLIDFCSK